MIWYSNNCFLQILTSAQVLVIRRFLSNHGNPVRKCNHGFSFPWSFTTTTLSLPVDMEKVSWFLVFVWADFLLGIMVNHHQATNIFVIFSKIWPHSSPGFLKTNGTRRCLWLKTSIHPVLKKSCGWSPFTNFDKPVVWPKISTHFTAKVDGSKRKYWALFSSFLFWVHRIFTVQVPGGPVKDSKGLAVQSTGRPKKSYEEVHGKVQSGFWEDEKWQNWRCSHAAGKGKKKKGWYVCLYCPIFSIAGLVFVVPKKWFVELFDSNMFSRA